MLTQIAPTVKERILEALEDGMPHRYRELLNEVDTADKVLYDYLNKLLEAKYALRDTSGEYPVYRITSRGLGYLKLLEDVKEARNRRYVPDLLDGAYGKPKLTWDSFKPKTTKGPPETIMEVFREWLREGEEFLREAAYLYKLIFSILLRHRFPYGPRAQPTLVLAKSVEIRLDQGDVDVKIYEDVYKLIRRFLKKNFPTISGLQEPRFTMSIRFDLQRGVERAIQWLDMMTEEEQNPQEKAKIQRLRNDLSSNNEKYAFEAYTLLTA